MIGRLKLQIDGKPVEIDRTGIIAVEFDASVVGLSSS